MIKTLLLAGALLLNGAWEMAYSPFFPATDTYPEVGEWTLVSQAVPGNWEDMVKDFRDAGMKSEFRVNPAYRPVRLPMRGWAPDLQLPSVVGTFYYRRSLVIGEAKPARLTFDCVRNQVQVWVNGRFVECHEGYSVPFAVDIPEGFLHQGTNELVLAVANNACPGYVGAEVRGLSSRAILSATGGIEGDVKLEFPEDDLDDIYVTTAADLRSFRVNVVGGPTEFAYEIVDGTRVVRKGRERSSFELPTAGLEMWSPERPQLYELRILTQAGSRSLRFGIRRMSVREGGLTFNGRPVYLRGVTEHCYFPETIHLPREVGYYRRIISRRKELGFNFIRFHTYVPPDEYLQAADELGMLVHIESPNFTPEWEYGEIIAFARRHPCAVIYCTGNETRIDRLAEAYLERIGEMVHSGTDALFSPMSALRGVEYMLSEQNDAIDASAPIPFNRERAKRLARYSDLFTSYQLDASSYEYIDGPSAREVDSWAPLYCGKPRLAHEICIDGTYADLSLEGLYDRESPIVKTGIFSETRKVLLGKGLLDRAGAYFTNSCELVARMRKFGFEKVRASKTTMGYDFLGDINHHWHTCGYSVGMMDEFYRLKPGETVERVLQYNSPAVILADFGSDFVFSAGQTRVVNFILSNFMADESEGRLRVTLMDAVGGAVVQDEEIAAIKASNGGNAEIGAVKVRFPMVSEAKKYLLRAEFTGDSVRARNEWECYAFPEPAKPRKPSTVRVVDDIGADELLSAMKRGERLLVMGAGPFNSTTTSFTTGRAGRCSGNFATIIQADHPSMAGFPHDGYCGWQFRQLLNGANAVQLEADVPFDPVVDIASAVKFPIRQAMMFEYRVGEGRLLVCAFRFRASDPAACYLKDRVLDYVESDQFMPKHAISVDQLARVLSAPRITSEANPNRARNPGDESGSVRAGRFAQP